MIPKIPFTPIQKISYDIEQSQRTFEKVANKLSSGKNYEYLKDLSENHLTENFLLLNHHIENSESYISSNNTIILRSSLVKQSISQMYEIANNFAEALTSRINGASGSLTSFDMTIISSFEEIESNLNISLNGYYLFSGSKTNTPPVKDIDISNVDTEKNLNSVYYQGDDNILSSNINETESFEYGVLANDPTFKKLIASVHIAKEGHEKDNSKILGEALDLLEEAVDEIISLEASERIKAEHIENTNSNIEDSKIFLDNSLSLISDVDIVSTTTYFHELQAQIEAAMHAFTILSSLQLSKFL